MNGPLRRIGFALREALWPALALLVLAAGVAAQIEQPGLYFDEVYVDYMVVPLVQAHPVELPAQYWLPPGNYLFGRLPLLVQLYHGALPLYLGLPLYAVLGTDVAAVRIVHGAFAAAVLVLAWLLMRRASVPPWIAGLAAIALALDPAFLFAFRTQYYILLVPLIPLLLGVLLAERARQRALLHRAELEQVGPEPAAEDHLVLERVADRVGRARARVQEERAEAGAHAPRIAGQPPRPGRVSRPASSARRACAGVRPPRSTARSTMDRPVATEAFTISAAAA
jgi:hypothetical protein